MNIATLHNISKEQLSIFPSISFAKMRKIDFLIQVNVKLSRNKAYKLEKPLTNTKASLLFDSGSGI